MVVISVHHGQAYHEIIRPMVSSSMTNKQTPAVSSGWEGNANSGSRGHSAACEFYVLQQGINLIVDSVKLFFCRYCLRSYFF